MAEPTPGPWEVSEITDINRQPSDGQFNKYLIKYFTPSNTDNSYGIETGRSLRLIATVRAQANKHTTRYNANLIAAAPTMYELLKRCMDIIIDYNNVDSFYTTPNPGIVRDINKVLEQIKGD